jgi:hypothetical protein
MNPTRKLCVLALTCAALLCASAGTAAAQTAAEQEAQDNLIRLVAATTSTTTGAFFIYGAMLLNEEQDELQQDVDIKKQFVLIDTYLDQNGHGARDAFAMGGGAALDDVANLMGHVGELGGAHRRALRAHRRALLDALDARRPGSLASAAHIHAIFASALRVTAHEEVTR